MLPLFITGLLLYSIGLLWTDHALGVTKQFVATISSAAAAAAPAEVPVCWSNREKYFLTTVWREAPLLPHPVVVVGRSGGGVGSGCPVGGGGSSAGVVGGSAGPAASSSSSFSSSSPSDSSRGRGGSGGGGPGGCHYRYHNGVCAASAASVSAAAAAAGARCPRHRHSEKKLDDNNNIDDDDSTSFAAGSYLYKQYYTSLVANSSSYPTEPASPSDPTREISREDILSHPEYRDADPNIIDATNGQQEIKQYLTAHRKPSLRRTVIEAHALAIWTPAPARPPPFDIVRFFKLFSLIALSASIMAFAGFGALKLKLWRDRALTNGPDGMHSRECFLRKTCDCYQRYASYFRTGPPAAWIATYRAQQASTSAALTKLRRQNAKLRRQLEGASRKQARLIYRNHELRQDNDWLIGTVKELTRIHEQSVECLKDMRKEVHYAKKGFEIAMLVAEPEQAMLDRAMQVADTTHERWDRKQRQLSIRAEAAERVKEAQEKREAAARRREDAKRRMRDLHEKYMTSRGWERTE